MTAKTDRPIVEATLESGEVVAHLLMHGDVLAEVPLIGTAIKICKAADAIRDRAFAIKLSQFLLNLDDISDEQKKKLKEKMCDKSAEAQKVGETLLFILERVTDLDKPLLLSQIFLAYIDGVITSAELRRISQAVDTAFADDLKWLLTIAHVPDKSNEPWMQYLVAFGLTEIVSGKTIDETGKIYYEATPLAHKLRSAFSHAQRQTPSSPRQRA